MKVYEPCSDHKAAGNGTTDDTAAVQASIDDADANGGTVVISHPHKILPTASTIKGSDNLDYKYGLRLKAGVKIVGESNGRLVFPFDHSYVSGNWTVCLAAQDADGWSVEGLVLDGGETAAATEWNHQGIMASSCRDFVIEGVEGKGFGGKVARVDSRPGGVTAADFAIRELVASNCVSNIIGIHTAEHFSVHDVRGRNNLNVPSGGGAEGIIAYCKDASFDLIDIADWGTGISLMSIVERTQVSRVRVRLPTTGTGVGGIGVGVGGAIKDVQISDVFVDAHLAALGVSVAGSFDGLTIRGARVRHDGAGQALSVLPPGASTDLLIEGVVAAGAGGFTVADNITGAAVHGNLVSGAHLYLRNIATGAATGNTVVGSGKRMDVETCTNFALAANQPTPTVT